MLSRGSSPLTLSLCWKYELELIFASSEFPPTPNLSAYIGRLNVDFNHKWLPIPSVVNGSHLLVWCNVDAVQTAAARSQASIRNPCWLKICIILQKSNIRALDAPPSTTCNKRRETICANFWFTRESATYDFIRFNSAALRKRNSQTSLAFLETALNRCFKHCDICMEFRG